MRATLASWKRFAAYLDDRNWTGRMLRALHSDLAPENEHGKRADGGLAWEKLLSLRGKAHIRTETNPPIGRAAWLWKNWQGRKFYVAKDWTI